jgi:putative transcriptional regulator
MAAFASFRPDVQPSMSKMTISSQTTNYPLRRMTKRQVEAAAKSDPDNRPLSRTDLRRMKRTPQVKIIRRALGISQEDFAARYHIPIGTLRDWEQGRAAPDQAARAYLTVIARDPESVRKALIRPNRPRQ